MKKKDAFVWGEKIKVDTPHIDSLARDGALFTNYLAVAPLCTPSRGSFMTGLYPKFSGAYQNHAPMKGKAITFAEVLQKNGGYYTGYIGKWHLNGLEKPGFENPKRPFGFDEYRYQFNRGHWKIFDEKENGDINVHEWIKKEQFESELEEKYATDFLFDRGMDFIKKCKKKGKHYAVMLSIPDPHGPNHVRAPYDRMYNRFKFKLPDTAVSAYKKQPANPSWAHLSTDLGNTNRIIEDIENDEGWQQHMRNYFGMVKLIDDKVGELLRYLKKSGQEENTIVVFTSDHGDLMGEHGHYNKNRPYMTSAGVPFIVRYPKRVMKGKRVLTAYTSPDFTPTILGLMGVDYSNVNFQGIDGSEEMLNKQKFNLNQQIRFMTDSKQAKWAAAIDRQYKLILSNTGDPYLYDLKADPTETINFRENARYENITETLTLELVKAIKQYKFQLGDNDVTYLSPVRCSDSKDQVPGNPNKLCNDFLDVRYNFQCSEEDVSKYCPDTCNSCCEDTDGRILFKNGSVKRCDTITDEECAEKRVRKFCPVTCKDCIPPPTSLPSSDSTAPPTTNSPTVLPSLEPSLVPTSSPSVVPSIQPTGLPSLEPTSSPTTVPSVTPTILPSLEPSLEPTLSPSTAPSEEPTVSPSLEPTLSPSTTPSEKPTDLPSLEPSSEPTSSPSILPTIQPSALPTSEPSVLPSSEPTSSPSALPTSEPSILPSLGPTSSPSTLPSVQPSILPSEQPSEEPTSFPTTENPTEIPSKQPTSSPSTIPSDKPSALASKEPSEEPTIVPTTNNPTLVPSEQPTSTPSTKQPTSFPSSSDPTTSPTTDKPSTFPTEFVPWWW